VDGSNVTRLTNTLYTNIHSVFSPDGNKIAFVSDRGSNDPNNRNYDIYVMNADGSNQTPLTNTPATDVQPAFSPDGSKIVFSRDFRIYVMNADGSNPINISTSLMHADRYPFYSPDGSKIAFGSLRNGGSTFKVYTMNADGSNQILLTNTSGFVEDDNPTWGGPA
jgi:Tol biopolymer transport system component